MPRWPNIYERFWCQVDTTIGHGPHGDCWIWTGETTKGGYGRFKIGNRKFLAHRVVWEWTHGVIPEGLKILHKCDTPACVRHLFKGSQRDNVRDSLEKGRRPSRAPGSRSHHRGAA